MKCYTMHMNAETILKENTRFDRKGSPLEVIVPYETFIDFIEEYGLDLTEEERKAIRETEADIAAGKHENFVSSDEAKKILGL